MRYFLKYIAMLLPVVLSVCSCSNMLFEDGLKNGDMNVGRTVLVYMAADNNLAPYARKNIEDMKQGEVPDYFDDGSGNVLLVYADITGEEPKLIRLSRDRFGTVTEETLRVYDDQNSCSDSVMSAVLSDAATLFPSQESGLVLWSHGTGWLPEGYYSDPVYSSPDGAAAVPYHIEDPYAHLVKSFGTDDGAEMDIRDLAGALPGHYSFILMDACLMGGVEVAYELRNKCDYFIGSAAEILANGFPYREVVGEIFRGEEGLRNACRLYREHYEDDGATIALVSTRSLGALADACRDVFASERDFIRELDMDSVQGYFRMNRHWFYDLGDFVEQLTETDSSVVGKDSVPVDDAVAERRERMYKVFRDALDEAVVYKDNTDEFVLGGYSQFSIKKFSGLSTYIPNPENPILDEYYRTLAWNKAVMMVE